MENLKIEMFKDMFDIENDSQSESNEWINFKRFHFKSGTIFNTLKIDWWRTFKLKTL